jgi:protein associated with RNAse G/E
MTGETPRPVHIDLRKWPDVAHWQVPAVLLGEDSYGTWLAAAGSTMVHRGEEPPRQLGHAFVGLVPHDAWWLVEFYWDHPWHTVYVNIGTPPTWHGDTVTQIDLDLDVVRKIDGTVEVLDEDEFATHRELFGYPNHLVEAATDATARAKRLLENHSEPFDRAPQHWLVTGQSFAKRLDAHR